MYYLAYNASNNKMVIYYEEDILDINNDDIENHRNAQGIVVTFDTKYEAQVYLNKNFKPEYIESENLSGNNPEFLL